MSERRALRDRLSRFGDPETDTDPRVRALLAELHNQTISPPLSTQFLTETRTALLASAPRLIAEGEPEVAEARTGAPGRRRIAHRRAYAIAAGLAMGVLVLSGAGLLSRNALPGDALYPLKRAGENVELALTSGDVDRAEVRLEHAGARLDEVDGLLSRVTAFALRPGINSASSEINDHTAKLITDDLDNADSNVNSASSALTDHAERTKSPDALTVLTRHLDPLMAQTTRIAARVPAGPLRSRIEASAERLAAAENAAAALTESLSCGPSCATTTPPVSTPTPTHPAPRPTQHRPTPARTTAPVTEPTEPPAPVDVPPTTQPTVVPTVHPTVSPTRTSPKPTSTPTTPTSTPPPSPTCPDGTQLNSAGTECTAAPTVTCTYGGYPLNLISLLCAGPAAADGSCPPAYWNLAGICAGIPVVTCPPGTTLDGQVCTGQPTANGVPKAGVVLAVPMLIMTGLFSARRRRRH